MKPEHLDVTVIHDVLARNLPRVPENGGESRPTSCPRKESASELFDAVTSSVWRRTRIDQYSADDVREKIARAYASGAALEFSIPFGGYKGWHVRSCPHVNWAEVFFLKYLQMNGRRIAAFHESGVEFVFTYTSGALEWMSNYPRSWQEKYLDEFSSLLAMYNTECVRFSMTDIASLYDSAEHMQRELMGNYQAIRECWDIGLTEKEKRIDSARRNLVPVGVEDLTSLNEDFWTARVIESAMRCDAVDRLRLRRSFNKFSSRIQLVLVRGPVPAVHIGCCRGSSYHFWVGSGCVDFREGKGAIERIGSERSLSSGRDSVLFEVPDVFTLDLPGLDSILALG